MDWNKNAFQYVCCSSRLLGVGGGVCLPGRGVSAYQGGGCLPARGVSA